EETLHVIGSDGMAAAERRDPGIPGRCVQFREPPALRDLPGERVLATAGPQDQDLHVREFKVGSGCFKYRIGAVGALVWWNQDLIATSGSRNGSSSSRSSSTRRPKRSAISTT